MGPSPLRAARDRYLAENGFRVEEYDAPWTDASFFFIPLKIPNTPRHRTALRAHDLHHVATGYGTDLVGEAEISIFEWRRSGARLGVLPGCDVYVSAIVTSLALFGAVFAPRRALAAWKAAAPSEPQAKTTLFDVHDDDAYEHLLEADVATLRAHLGLPASGIAVGPQKRHPRAPRS
jgi:hypothetical protein